MQADTAEGVYQALLLQVFKRIWLPQPLGALLHSRRYAEIFGRCNECDSCLQPYREGLGLLDWFWCSVDSLPLWGGGTLDRRRSGLVVQSHYQSTLGWLLASSCVMGVEVVYSRNSLYSTCKGKEKSWNRTSQILGGHSSLSSDPLYLKAAVNDP